MSWRVFNILCAYFIFLATPVYTKFSSSVPPVGFSVEGMHKLTSFCPYCHIRLYASYLRTVTLGRYLRLANLGV